MTMMVMMVITQVFLVIQFITYFGCIAKYPSYHENWPSGATLGGSENRPPRPPPKDTGGQYQDGTTDVTRTVHFGTPTEVGNLRCSEQLISSVNHRTCATLNAYVYIVSYIYIYTYTWPLLGKS